MAHPCPVCVHDSRAAIEQAILAGKPKSSIARNFGFFYTSGKTGEKVANHKSIQGHIDRCMPTAYQRAMEEREVQSGVAMAARLTYLDEQVDLVIEKAKAGTPVVVGDAPLLDEDGRPVLRYDFRLLLAAVREGRGNMELLGKLTGRTEHDPEDTNTARAHLQSPEARRLLARLEELAAAEEAETARQQAER